MSPRPGGEADKLGNRYELAWAVRHALYCIKNEGHSITLEDPDPALGNGSEFTYRGNESIEVHQLKRQSGNANSWTVKSLNDYGVFDAARGHVSSNRTFHFVSRIPCRKLQELTERARNSPNVADFVKYSLSDSLRTTFDTLTNDDIFNSVDIAWETLRGTWFTIQDEEDLFRQNEYLAQCSLTGANGALIASAIERILLDSLGKKLTQVELLEKLQIQGITPIGETKRKTAREQVRQVTQSWRNSVQHELLEPRIHRVETEKLIEALDSHRICFVSGAAGGGKSALLEQTVDILESKGSIVFAFRLDRYEAFTSLKELDHHIGLKDPLAMSLAIASEDREAYLIIDQLDAVSLASGRMPDSFSIISDLIREVLSENNVKVILACRSFDIENDHRIRSLADQRDTTTINVGSLPDDAIDVSLAEMGITPSDLTDSQREILRTPMHLVLLKATTGHAGCLEFKSKGALFERYWERKREESFRRRKQVRFYEVIVRVATELSKRQTLSISIEVLDDDDLIEDANVLISEHILSRDADRISFFHESFFDYAFARHWTNSSDSLIEFLKGDKQDLFRRAQVRQILQYLSERDPDRFRVEVIEILLNNQIRFHIKHTVLAVLSSLSVVTSADTDTLFQILQRAPNLADQLWKHTCQAPWFKRFYEDQYIDTWLDSKDTLMQGRAVNLMISAAQKYPMLVSKLLNSRRSAPEYPDWVRRIALVSDLHISRNLFEELLAAARNGRLHASDGEAWMAVDNLAQRAPLWSIEVIQAFIIDHPENSQLNSDGKVGILEIQDHTAIELIRLSATAEPLVFAQTVVPYLLQVMAMTAFETNQDDTKSDRHFYPKCDPDETLSENLGDSLFHGAEEALKILASNSPGEVRPLLEDLANDPHAAAQFLLYRALISGRVHFANWAGALLLEGGARLECGYRYVPSWIARELLHAISPFVNESTHLALEELVRDLRNPYENHHGSGRRAFTFLSAMKENRLSQSGKRRLAEYRRKFNEKSPSEPQGIVTGSIQSPISSEDASKMSDDQWLTAMSKYDSAGHDRVNFKGGADELSHVLRSQATKDPKRFSLLALRLTSGLHPAYASSLLSGIADAEHSAELAPLLFEAIRHIATLGHDEVDQRLGYALKHYLQDAPLDLVELILDRALRNSDPPLQESIPAKNDEDIVSAANMRHWSINTARGHLSAVLGNLLVYDADGERTELVRPHLISLASDPDIYVRASVAHTVTASLRHAQPEAVEAFHQLVDTDDRILASHEVQRLIFNIGNVSLESIESILERMIVSAYPEVRRVGGMMLAEAALEWGRDEMMARALTGDPTIRKGAAEICANRIVRTSNLKLATSTLKTLMDDDDVEVREAVAKVAVRLRNHPLRPFSDILESLSGSRAFAQAIPQLLITLLDAPDRIDEIALQVIRRFLTEFGSNEFKRQSRSVFPTRYVTRLVIRGLAQSRDANHRSALLDSLDNMLELGFYGVEDSVAATERR